MNKVIENQEERLAKHLILNESINKLRELEVFIEHFLYEITGEKNEDNIEKAPEENPHLRDVLDHSPNRIRTARKNILNNLTKIRESIFCDLEPEIDKMAEKTEDEYKHVRIKHTIDDLSDIMIYAINLLADIKGEELGTPKDEEIKTSGKSLEYILTNGYKIIDKIYVETRKIVEEIKDILF